LNRHDGKKEERYVGDNRERSESRVGTDCERKEYGGGSKREERMKRRGVEGDSGDLVVRRRAVVRQNVAHNLSMYDTQADTMCVQRVVYR
jgi:hypothetical protein